VVGDDVGIGSVRVDDGDLAAAVDAVLAEVDQRRRAELRPVRRPRRPAGAREER
jgi:hypothetical protein